MMNNNINYIFKALIINFTVEILLDLDIYNLYH